MKTNKWFLALTCVGALLINNVLSAVEGKVSTNFQSNAEYRGQSVGDDVIGAKLNVSEKFGEFTAGVGLSTLNSLESSASLHLLDFGISTALIADKLTGSVGWLGTDSASYDNEIYAKLSLQSLLTPSVTLYRNTEESLYNVVFGVSTGEIAIDGLPVNLIAGVDLGFVERTAADSDTYVEAHVCAVKSVTDSASLVLGIEYDDSEHLDNEVGFVLGLNVSF